MLVREGAVGYKFSVSEGGRGRLQIVLVREGEVA